MSSKSVIIIGAGIAGLSAGCYLQMNGYNTEIFEAHNLPGGLCTAWRRGEYTIEGCIHGLLGSSPSHPYYKLWNEIVDMQEIGFADQDIKEVYDFGQGRKFIEYANLEKLESCMKAVAPCDADAIEEFIRDTRRFQKVEMPVDKPREFFNLMDIFKMTKYAPLFFLIKKWAGVSSEDFSKRFKSPLLRDVVRHFSSPVLFEMFVLSEMDLKRCGYPRKGSMEFSRLFEKKYIECGGRINYRRKVSRILVEADKAVGIELENGDTYKADIIISAADGRATIFEMLQGKYLTGVIKEQYGKGGLNSSRIQIALGINNTFEDLPRTVKLVLASPLLVSDGSTYDAIDVLIYNDAPELCPQGKTLMVVQLATSNDEYWTELKKTDGERYSEEKRKAGEAVIELLDERIGNVKGKVEMVDVATPATYIRYTYNWKGSIQGWENANIFRANPFKKELTTLSGFYMAGQWVEPGGGIPAVFKSGRDLAQIICRRDGKKFITG